ncbi:MAG TPA: hypothetical protein VME92_08060 [Acetobacteraceae bacterium]|nr:hypothetical protein [Acetobacteraceae bacterium]
MPTTVRSWLGDSLPPIGSVWLSTQEVLQAHFLSQQHLVQHPVTRRVYKKLAARVGKLFWGQSEPAPAKASKFSLWSKTKRSSDSERTLNMNCWEAVLYGLYQADGVDAPTLARYYNRKPATTAQDYDAKQRPLFGTQTVLGNGAGPQPGDILTFEDSRNGMLNHMGMYAGQYAGTQYILHLLSLDQASTHMSGFGVLHFEPVSTTLARYAGTGGCTAYYTEPFWEPNSPTNAYFTQL